MISAILATIGCILLFCRIKKLATALAVLQNVVNVNSDELPSFIYENVDKKLEPQDNVKESILSEFKWIHGVLALAVLIFIILIIIFFYDFLFKKEK